MMVPVKAEDRKLLLEMARRRAGPGAGSTLSEVREARTAYAGDTELPDLGGVRYIIVGGLATALYMPQRMTIDTDLLILGEDLSDAEGRLEAAGCERIGPLTIGGSSWRLPGGRNLDLIALDRPWAADAIASAVHDEKGRPFATLPYLVLMKLESGRLQDLADISRMLGCAKEDRIDAVREIVSRYRPQDAEDVESMLRLGKLEHE